MFDPAVSDQWWKDAVVHCVDVERFMDSDGDGIGDFRGLTQRLPHLSGLGVTCLWLLPFHPSPRRDDGYDVADHHSVDPRLSSLGEFGRTARDLGIRVVTDLVVNHTSSEHPCFREARRSRDSRYRNWYVEPEDLQQFDQFADVFGNDRFDPLDPADPVFRLSPHGYRWLRGRVAGSEVAL